ncbi:G-rich sequence factor 1 [Geodia barretti]|uniref:G-rich sequence factor 1 n=1 Tax=Geodia barretti TaxID=519541 RepID=A0AA35RTG2_GEOBA|nr:G-rich sequence factor 1 [Geodia barretti]
MRSTFAAACVAKMAASPHTQQSEGSAPVQGGPDGYREVCFDRVVVCLVPRPPRLGTTTGIMARGLPYDATKNEVAEFFSGCRIRNGHDGIHILVGQDGRLQGEAVIELEGQEDLDKAKQLNNQMMGRRYIEISPLSQAAADQTLASQPGGSSTEFVVRLRGLPYSATSREILDLLNDCQVAGGDKGIRFSFAPDGRPSARRLWS